jgi:putative addiction module component (TIGR02574 family)
MSYNTEELLKLPVIERYDIAVALWESIEDEDLPITEEEKILAEIRLLEHLNNPKDILKWEDAREQIKKEYGI